MTGSQVNRLLHDIQEVQVKEINDEASRPDRLLRQKMMLFRERPRDTQIVSFPWAFLPESHIHDTLMNGMRLSKSCSEILKLCCYDHNLYLWQKSAWNWEQRQREESLFHNSSKGCEGKRKKCNKKVLKQRICQSSSCSQHTAAFFEFNSRNCLLDFSYWCTISKTGKKQSKNSILRTNNEWTSELLFPILFVQKWLKSILESMSERFDDKKASTVAA